uniref:Uncharacterized protein n=1 Tax=Anguilla anguilla TaxID=7936 RepID=A0A0E9RL23_ANGAN
MGEPHRGLTSQSYPCQATQSTLRGFVLHLVPVPPALHHPLSASPKVGQRGAGFLGSLQGFCPILKVHSLLLPHKKD